eukprot:3390549-Pyramimonas_sp.AAC.1
MLLSSPLSRTTTLLYRPSETIETDLRRGICRAGKDARGVVPGQEAEGAAGRAGDRHARPHESAAQRP